MRGFDTAKAAAARHGFNYTTYSQHERGAVGITRAAKHYAKAYKVREAWLLTGEGSAEEAAPTEGSAELREAFARVAAAPPEVQEIVLSYVELVLNNFEKSRKIATAPLS